MMTISKGDQLSVQLSASSSGSDSVAQSCCRLDLMRNTDFICVVLVEYLDLAIFRNHLKASFSSILSLS